MLKATHNHKQTVPEVLCSG